jgi:hypothetical protein
MSRFNNQVVFQLGMRSRTLASTGTDLQWNRAGRIYGESQVGPPEDM